MTRPLEGVRVLDLTWAQQGPYATVMLSDMGADVIKVEPREGELGRQVVAGIYPQPAPYFVAHNRGKRGIALDIRKPEGREVILRYAKEVDVIVHNMRPGVMEKLGLAYSDLRAVNAKIIYASASAFGPLGEMAPLPGFDIIGQAMGGIMSKTGEEGSPPIPAGAAIGDQVGALYLCSGILAGLVKVARTGEGEQIDVSLYGCQIGLQAWEITEQSIIGKDNGRAGLGHPIVSRLSLWSCYATTDGAIVLGGVDSERFKGLCAVAELPELAQEYADEITRAINITKVREAVSEAFRAHPTQYWLDALRSVDVIVAPVQNYDDIINDPQAWDNGYMTTLDHSVHGEVKVVGCPIQFGRQPTEPQGPPPELGQDTETCLLELGYSWDQVEALRAGQVI